MIFDNLVVAVDGIFNDVSGGDANHCLRRVEINNVLEKRRPQISESFGYLWSSY